MRIGRDRLLAGQTIDNEFFMLTSEPLEAVNIDVRRALAVEYFDLDKLGDRLRLRTGRRVTV
jgi:hypothetical protein